MRIHRQQQGNRKEQGTILPLIAVIGLALVTLLVAFFRISFDMSKGQGIQSRVDAGALALGRKALSVKVAAEDKIEHEFDDVADKQKLFGLTNINRVWAKALLASVNAQSMNNTGMGSGLAHEHAHDLYLAAHRISKRLSLKLQSSDTMLPFFNNLAQKDALNDMGGNSVVSGVPASLQTALVNRTVESNIDLKLDQLPQGTDLAALHLTTATDGKNYVPGYQPMNADGNQFSLVAYKLGELPQLISQAVFNKNTVKAAPYPWQTPVPNAFSVTGSTPDKTGSSGQKATSTVLTNPQQTFKLAMPHAFVRIKLDGNHARYWINGVPMVTEDYGYYPQVETQGEFPAGVGTMTVFAGLGMEYLPPNLYRAIYGLPGGKHEKVMQAILQRVKEIDQNFTYNDLVTLLLAEPIVPGVSEYLIYPAGNRIIVTPAAVASIAEPWIHSNAKADGSQKNLCNETSFFLPNFVIPILKGAGQPIYLPSLTYMYGTEKWTPGTGFDQCLGQIDIERNTELIANGIVIPTP